MNTILDETGSGIGWRTVDLQNAALVARYTLVLQVLDQRFRNRLADGFIVERHVKIGGRIRDRTVIGDDLDTLGLGQLDQRGCRRRVNRIKHDHLRALRNDRVELLLLLARIAIGIEIKHLAAFADLLHLGGKARIITLLITCGSLIRHQEADHCVLHFCLSTARKRGQHHRSKSCLTKHIFHVSLPLGFQFCILHNLADKLYIATPPHMFSL